MAARRSLCMNVRGQAEKRYAASWSLASGVAKCLANVFQTNGRNPIEPFATRCRINDSLQHRVDFPNGAEALSLNRRHCILDEVTRNTQRV